jgi:unsaturated rhamnogalacturonyl hydrolase
MEEPTTTPDPGHPSPPWSVRMADSVIRRHTPASARWAYEHGLALMAIQQVGQRTGSPRYPTFVKDSTDLFIDGQGNIHTYKREDYNLDQINHGRVLFELYRTTGDDRYRQAIFHLRRQLTEQPRVQAGGFWHKQIYPNQMWLDGLYMAGPFYAQFGATFDEPACFDDVAHQLRLVERQTRDPRTGLLYHAWDESKQQRWADPASGCSPHFWGRAMGWYVMALVDVLDFLPPAHPARLDLVEILRRAMTAITSVQDPASGAWYQVLDQQDRPGNYLEASASAMFVYSAAKGIRQGSLPGSYREMVNRGYRGLLDTFITVDEQGLANLGGICGTAGLGGSPYRDGSFEYYVGERIVPNDYKGVGPFILASLEHEAGHLA